jgi:hypothetical protein
MPRRAVAVTASRMTGGISSSDLQSDSIFEIVKKDAAWQAARLRFLDQSPFKAGWREKRDTGGWTCYFAERFPEAVTDIVDGRSFISCNLVVDGLYDVDSYLEKCRHLQNPRDIADAWFDEGCRDPRIDTCPPLLGFVEIRRHSLLPE